ncbi:MAG: hypothetical protein DYG99_02150 [Bacteroidetes bacterium CHB5]|nr:hypothetical protein [Bacteroidetes bacterium CHB5]
MLINLNVMAVSAKQSRIFYGILIANLVSLVLVGGSKYLATYLEGENAGTSSGVFIFSSFVIVPLLMGGICAWYWHPLQMKTKHYIGWSVVTTLIACAASFLFLKEGAICLIIVLPLILCFTIAGALLARMLYNRKNNTLNSSVAGLAILVLVVDTFSSHKNLQLVSDTLIVNAPIEKVWPHVVEYKPITLKEEYWLFQIGMPSPVQSTVDGYEAGAGRKCIFSNGYVFDEKMIVYKPNEELTFDIISQPHDPEIMGHIDIVRGQFLLKDNGDGTTTVIGNSWYKLYVFPGWYFNLWSESITRNVHLRVMEHIKILSENHV